MKNVVVPLHFLGSTSTIFRFGECFRGGQYSWVSFLYAVFLLTVPPPCPAICKSGKEHVLQCPMELAPLSVYNIVS